jgi:hypothetical protein
MPDCPPIKRPITTNSAVIAAMSINVLVKFHMVFFLWKNETTLILNYKCDETMVIPLWNHPN